jgi:DNA repair protein RadC
MKRRRLTLKELPEEERPREKLIQNGASSLSDTELIAIILSSGTRAESAMQIAQRILLKAHDLKTLSAMSVKELSDFSGIGPARATSLKAALELARRYKEKLSEAQPKFSSSQMVFEYFGPGFRGKSQEEFWTIALDAKNKLISSAQITRGTLMGSLVHPRDIFEMAIRNKAAGIIILHNHPSGDPHPSVEDRKVTGQVAEAGKILGIPLLDHVIIGNESYFSFKDSGLV